MPDWLDKMRGGRNLPDRKEDHPVTDEAFWLPRFPEDDPPDAATTADMPIPTRPNSDPEPPPVPDETPAGVGALFSAMPVEGDGDVEEEDHDDCPTCSRPLPTVHELLTDIFTRAGDNADQFVISFYTRVARARPDVLHLFPADLVDPESSGRGRAQRDRLLRALVLVATLYSPRNPASMAKLDKALDELGGTHGESRFFIDDPEWPGGTRPLLQREYDAVNTAAVETFREFYGRGWSPLHTAAIWRALTYAADRMGAVQILDLPRHAR
jgi:hypothetical protein